MNIFLHSMVSYSNLRNHHHPPLNRGLHPSYRLGLGLEGVGVIWPLELTITRRPAQSMGFHWIEWRSPQLAIWYCVECSDVGCAVSALKRVLPKPLSLAYDIGR